MQDKTSSSRVIKHHPQIEDTEYSDSDDDDSRPIPSPFSVIGDDPIDPDEVDMTEMEETANDDASNEDSDEEEESGPLRNIEDQSITTEHPLPWFGFKITGDNVDKNIRPLFQRSDHGTISLHHFHSFAARDRLDLSNLSGKDPDLSTAIGDINAEKFLPSEQDIEIIKEEFCILVARYDLANNNIMVTISSIIILCLQDPCSVL